MEVTVRTILVPLDGSALSERALPYARLLAPIMDAKVCLLQIISGHDHDQFLSEILSTEYGSRDALVQWQERARMAWQSLRQHAEGYLETQAMALRDAGIDVSIEVGFNSVAENIVDIAEHRRAALIIMASHCYSGFQRLTHSCVSDKVVHASSTPVLLVRDGRAPAETLRRILVPVSGSQLSQQALPFAADLAAAAGAELRLIEAIMPAVEVYPGFPPIKHEMVLMEEASNELCAAKSSALRALADSYNHPGMVVTTRVANGDPTEVIISEAEHCEADMIVMATHGYGLLRRWAMGSVADSVFHATTLPLVLVHAKG